MFDAIFTTSEYLVISSSAFLALGEPLAALFDTVCYLLVGTGNDEPVVACWRSMTLAEASSVTCQGQVPIQSTRLYTLFYRLSMLSLVIRNIVVPLYLSSSSLWSGKNDAIDAVYQLVYTALSQSFLRLPRGENVEFSAGCERV